MCVCVGECVNVCVHLHCSAHLSNFPMKSAVEIKSLLLLMS